MPIGIGCVFCDVPVEIRRAIVPPYGTTLTECALDLIDALVSVASAAGSFAFLAAPAARRAAISLATRSALRPSANSGFAMRHNLK